MRLTAENSARNRNRITKVFLHLFFYTGMHVLSYDYKHINYVLAQAK